MKLPKNFLMIGHRGASAYEPENTMASFKKAIKMNVDAIECDVRLSKDRKIVIIHDKTIDRTTDSSGKVKKLTARQLKKFQIPELQELLNLIKKTDVLLFIEIKEHGVEKALAKIIEKNKIENQVIVVSFFWDSLKKIKEINNNIRTGYSLIHRHVGLKAGFGFRTGFIFRKLRPGPIETALKINADFILPRYHLVTKKLIDTAHRYNFKVFTWTVDNVRMAQEFISWGIDGIASNMPDLLD